MRLLQNETICLAVAKYHISPRECLKFPRRLRFLSFLRNSIRMVQLCLPMSCLLSAVSGSKLKGTETSDVPASSTLREPRRWWRGA